MNLPSPESIPDLTQLFQMVASLYNYIFTWSFKLLGVTIDVQTFFIGCFILGLVGMFIFWAAGIWAGRIDFLGNIFGGD